MAAKLTKEEIRSLVRSAGGCVVVASTAEAGNYFQAFNTLDARKFHGRNGLPVSVATETGMFVFASHNRLDDDNYLENFVTLAAKLEVTQVISSYDD